MRRVGLMVMAGALYVIAAGPAAAFDYPYCLQSRSVGIPGDCSYQSYEQCMASASGRGAGCAINPRVAFSKQPRPERRNRGQAPY